MPDIGPAETPFSSPWYGELDFESNPIFRTELQEDIKIDAKIRILQDRRVSGQTLITLADGVQYDVKRVYHGVDEESGEPISDISLSRAVSEYDAD